MATQPRQLKWRNGRDMTDFVMHQIDAHADNHSRDYRTWTNVRGYIANAQYDYYGAPSDAYERHLNNMEPLDATKADGPKQDQRQAVRPVP